MALNCKYFIFVHVLYCEVQDLQPTRESAVILLKTHGTLPQTGGMSSYAGGTLALRPSTTARRISDATTSPAGIPHRPGNLSSNAVSSAMDGAATGLPTPADSGRLIDDPSSLHSLTRREIHCPTVSPSFRAEAMMKSLSSVATDLMVHGAIVSTASFGCAAMRSFPVTNSG